MSNIRNSRRWNPALGILTVYEGRRWFAPDENITIKLKGERRRNETVTNRDRKDNIAQICKNTEKFGMT